MVWFAASLVLGCSAETSDTGPTEARVEEIRCGGTTCALAGATATCHRGRCVIASCGWMLGDCNHRDPDGCEVNLGTSVTSCGSCGHACRVRANATASCAQGACASTCNPGFADCDGNAANGCEVNLNADGGNCGACGASCGPMGSTCCTGRCTYTGGDLNNCGGCGVVCAAGANATPACLSGACALTCNPGYADCDRSATNGCEALFTSDVNNCGACGVVCTADQSCLSGRCGTVTLSVSLAWNMTADMDLHVVTPAGHEIFFGATSADGGQFDHDSTAMGPEVIGWVSPPPAGTYLVCAVPYSVTVPTSFTVTVTNGATAVATFSGTNSASAPMSAGCSRTSPSFVGDFTL